MPIPEKHLLPDIDRAVQDAAFDRHRANLKVIIWDRMLPINGVAADHWLGQCDVGSSPVHPACSSPRRDTPSSGDIYLVEEDGHTLVFQPHHPGGGPMTGGEGQATGDDHADRIAANRVAQELSPAARR